ncbi:uncharacterized protein TRIADDRAFT_54252 [Trichoplax adhaerens]|uniref:protein-serine/threonine phosphatase n=1 Tax=Trichoplax adhaerens TaxID=10228 RepID=B3RRI6_TRIAD|nr:hypothetical protein TRIADDRAFT_54252 [Trichoplax adhaerens]EDV26882.1 hypothetical protein TRIADDRAFT_54252 [Trichoplax adhaerens]|eukprot:XP_002110878.1 hypothetical protein TRIADDRAFT_54252 [Trichoplax adhaerens]
MQWLKDDYTQATATLNLKCKLCQQSVSTSQLKQHKKIHLAYRYLKYRGVSKPENLKALQKRRKSLIRKLRRLYSDKEDPEYDRKLTRFNWAYELIKSTFDDAYYNARVVTPSSHEQLLGKDIIVIKSDSVPTAIYHGGSDQGRGSALDRIVAVLNHNFGSQGGKNCYYYGMYSGYHGCQAAEEAKINLHRIFANELSKEDFSVTVNEYSTLSLEETKVRQDDSIRSECEYESANIFSSSASPERVTSMLSLDQSIHQLTYSALKKRKKLNSFENYLLMVANAFRHAYSSFDTKLKKGIKEKSTVRWSGCSSLSCLLNFNPLLSKSGILHLANIGDIKGVLCRGGTGYILSRKHTLSNSRERLRVLKCGCTIKSTSSACSLVNGVLHVTRGFGNHGDPLLKSAVINTPHVTSISLTDEDYFLILATNSLWESIDARAAVEMLLNMHPFKKVNNGVAEDSKYQDSSFQQEQKVIENVQTKINNSKLSISNISVGLHSMSSNDYYDKAESAIGNNELPSLNSHTYHDVSDESYSLSKQGFPSKTSSVTRSNFRELHRSNTAITDASFRHSTANKIRKEAKTGCLIAKLSAEGVEEHEEIVDSYSDLDAITILEDEQPIPLISKIELF